MDGSERFWQLMKQRPPPDPETFQDADAHFVAYTGWMLDQLRRVETEGERLRLDEATREAGAWIAQHARLLLWCFAVGTDLNQNDPEGAGRFLQEQSLADG